MGTYMTYLINLKKLGAKSTVLASSIALVACGGGGSDGYYNNDSSNGGSGGNTGGNTEGNNSETNTDQIVDSIEVLGTYDLDGNKISQVTDDSVIEFKVQVLNKNKGGIANKSVTLAIGDSQDVKVTSEKSTVVTTDGGYAIFKLAVGSLNNTSTTKVQLSTSIQGTTIIQPYTLNISKKNVLQSEYEIKAEQAVEINLPNGSTSITAYVTDKNGGVKSGQNVTLSLNDLKDKFAITSGSTAVTNQLGQVTFTIEAKGPFSNDELLALLGKSKELTFTLVDERGAQKTAPASITFKDASQIIDKLEIIKEDKPVAAQDGITTVKVRAKNTKNIPLANKSVQLEFTDLSEEYGVRIKSKTAITDSEGYAIFTIETNSKYPVALSQQGINLRATYTDDNRQVEALEKITVITENSSSSDELALQRLEIQSSYKINAKNGSVEIKIKGIDNRGLAATKGKLTLKLNQEALDNAVGFEGSETQEFTEKDGGFITYTITTKANTQEAVDALVASGITATLTTDNNITTNVKIAVENDVKSSEAVHYLSIEPLNKAFDYTQDQVIKLNVKAIGKNGSALVGEEIAVSLPDMLVENLQLLGLSLKGKSVAKTDNEGYASFEYEYKVKKDEKNNILKGQEDLVKQGVLITATSISNSSATQTIKLNFKAPSDEIDLDYFNMDADVVGDMQLSVGEEKYFNVTVDVKGTDGIALKNQRLGIGLNQAALSNGVSLVSSSSLVTGENGQVVFRIKVKPSNTTELTNLIANGITYAVTGNRQDGSSYSLTKRIDVTQPPVILPNLTSLDIENAEGGALGSLSVLGDEVRVKVTAKDDQGNLVANTPIAVALSSLTSSRVSLLNPSTTTNSKGEAEFTIVVSEGGYDEELIKRGITFAVVGTNPRTGDLLTQTRKIEVSVPQNALNLTLNAVQRDLEIGSNYQIHVAVKDEIGTNKAYPVNLSLNDAAIRAGVQLSTESVLTNDSIAAPISLMLPKQIPQSAKEELIREGITVRGFIRDAKGSTIEATLRFTVSDVINQNYLTITSNKASLFVDGDRAIVTVELKTRDGDAPVAHQDVTLSALNSANIIIGTPGDGFPVNTSTSQTVKTDSLGRAFFAVDIADTAQQDLLLASGIELIAEHVDERGAAVSQVSRLGTREPNPTTPVLLDPIYSLRIESSKPAMNVKSDINDITVTLLDENGGGVADKYVSLGINNFLQNGAVIVGPSGLTTNEFGQATFRVRVDESARAEGYTAIDFDREELNLFAEYVEEGFRPARQIGRVIINNVTTIDPRASIVIGVNPTSIASSTDGVYYTKNVSVSVSDFDGRPLANQSVEMTIDAITYNKGKYIWALAPVIGGDPEAQWVKPGDKYYNNNVVTNPLVVNQGYTCSANLDGSAILNQETAPNTLLPVKVVNIVGKGEDKTATYTTDKEGKFDFEIRYPKIYANWLTIQIGASSIIATLPFKTTYNLGLSALTSDYSTDGTYGPNLTSPYGENDCP